MKSGLIKTIGVTAAIATATALGPRAYIEAQDSINLSATNAKLHQLETELSQEYDLQITVWQDPGPNPWGRFEVRDKTSLYTLSPYASLQALDEFSKTLRLYPPNIIKSHIDRIDLVHTLVPTYEQSQQGITPLSNVKWWGGMTFTAGSPNWKIYHEAISGTLFNRDNFHHELGHQLTATIDAENWRALQPEAKYHSDDWKQLETIPQGFFNKYATSSPREDIASTVELLYADNKKFKEKTSEDHILKKKTDFLERWYAQQDACFNEAYWESVRSGELPNFE